MTTLFVTILLSTACFGLLAVSLMLGRLFGRIRPRRCACAESRAIMKKFEERDAAARRAARYRSGTVDPRQLPLVDQTGDNH